MKGKALIPLVLGLCMGLLAVKFGMDTMKKAQGNTPVTEMRKVVRAKQDIDASLQLTPEMLELMETGDKAQPNDPDFAKPEDLADRVTEKYIPRGAVILASMLAEPGTPPGIPGRIEPGFRAVSVKIDEVSGVAFNVRPGAWVDVIVVMDVMDTATRKKQTIAEVVMEHIQVAAVGMSAATAEAGSKNKMARSATLLVPESEVPKLHLAATKGKITLAMRGEHDITINPEAYSAREDDLFMSTKAAEADDDSAADAESAKPADFDQAQLAALFAQMQAQQASHPATALEPPKEQPFTMLIARGTSTPGRPMNVQRITYETARSWNIISVTEGLPLKPAGFFKPDKDKDGGAAPLPAGAAAGAAGAAGAAPGGPATGWGAAGAAPAPGQPGGLVPVGGTLPPPEEGEIEDEFQDDVSWDDPEELPE